jgi:hypothetical protein
MRARRVDTWTAGAIQGDEEEHTGAGLGGSVAADRERGE